MTAQRGERTLFAKRQTALNNGEVLVYQLEDGTGEAMGLIGYWDCQERYLVKFTMSADSPPLSENLRQAFDAFVTKAEASIKESEESPKEALQEASRRVQKAGQEGMKNVKYSGGDGSSLEKAVIIRGASDMFGCVSAQYAWLEEHYPGYEFVMHAGGKDKGRHLSTIGIRHKDKQLSIVFDIADCESITP